MKNELDSNCGSPDIDNRGVGEGVRKQASFDEYMARLNPNVRNELPRELVNRMKNRWRTENRLPVGNSEIPVVLEDQGLPDGGGNKRSFSEYNEITVRRALEITGADLSSVIHLVAKHWDSSEWNDPSGSGREGD